MPIEAAPFFEDVADGPQGGAAHWLTTADGLRIRVGHWTGPQVRGTVIVFPGRTEYVEKYGRDARVLMEAGYATVAIDWRGQGIAARMQPNRSLGHVGEFADYQHDVRATFAHLEDLGLPKPWFLIGHSMGGCIALRTVMENRAPVNAVCFSAPMWGILMSAALRPMAWGLSTISRPLRFSHIFAPGQHPEPYALRATFEENKLTSDPDMYAYMRDQIAACPDLALGGPSLHWLNEALVEMRTLAARPSPSMDALTFLGTQEGIVDPARVKARMQAWPNGELVMVEGGRHEVLMETPERRGMIFEKMLAFFDAHV